MEGVGMATIKLTREQAFDVLEDDDNHVRDQRVAKHRWYEVRELIFKREGKLFAMRFQRGLSETQEDHDEFGDAEEVECEEVEAYEKTVTDYRPVST
jgi:hypothetical protein